MAKIQVSIEPDERDRAWQKMFDAALLMAGILRSCRMAPALFDQMPIDDALAQWDEGMRAWFAGTNPQQSPTFRAEIIDPEPQGAQAPRTGSGEA